VLGISVRQSITELLILRHGVITSGIPPVAGTYLY
jgi:hypothetical protein